MVRRKKTATYSRLASRVDHYCIMRRPATLDDLGSLRVFDKTQGFDLSGAVDLYILHSICMYIHSISSNEFACMFI